jgi:5-methylcytosine-specific restriction protein B
LKLEDLKSLIFGKDDYIGIAIREYMKFKGTKYWGEGYKWETFSGMNAEVGQKRINAENIVDHIKYYQKHNPPSGSFVHWSSISDLLAFAEDEPVTVAELKCPLCQDKNFIFLSEPDITSGRARLF